MAAGETQPNPATLQSLYDRRDFFALRDALEEIPESNRGSARLRFFNAATQQAFNQPAAANQTVDEILDERDLPGQLTRELRNLQLTNHLRQHDYGAALESARAILEQLPESPDSPLVAEVQAKLPLLRALATVPPQTTEIRGTSRLALGNTRRVPLTIQGVQYAFALDTGANFSVITRSEAEKLNLEIRPADLEISTSTARKVLGDVAVADEVEIGKIRYRNVVFLVLPDEVLSFPGGQRIPGLVGFPLVEAMGEVRFRRDNVMEIPKKPPRRSDQNLALDDLEPLLQVRHRKEDLLCRLDTGASHTVFYEPFFSRFQEQIESSGRSITAQATGVGGSQEISAYRMPKMVLTIASAGVTLRRVEVYTRSIRPPAENYLYCNVGLDALIGFRSYTLNFRDMSLVLN